MSQSSVINIVYFFVVAFVCALIGFSLSIGKIDGFPTWNVAATVPGVALANMNSVPDDGPFRRDTTPVTMKFNFETRHLFVIPDNLTHVYSLHRYYSAGVNINLYAIQGNVKDLKALASRLNCMKIRYTDSTLEKGGAIYARVMPEGWREMQLYRGTSHYGDDLRFYLDEAKGMAYITEQPIRCIVPSAPAPTIVPSRCGMAPGF